MKPISLHLMKGDRYLAVCDDKTLSVIDIEKGTVEKHTMGNKDTTKLFKLVIPDTNGTPAFATVTSNGQLKILSEVLLDSTNNLARTDMDPYRLDVLKIMKAGGIN